MDKRTRRKYKGAEKAHQRVNSDTALWGLIKGRYSRRTQSVVGSLGRGPTLTELSMMELAHHLDAQQEAAALEVLAGKAKKYEDKQKFLYEARQIRKTLQKSRELMRHLRALAGTDGNVDQTPVEVPQGLGLSVVPDEVDTSEDLVADG